MPYLAVELDALNAAPSVARMGGIHEDAAIAGLLRMWAYCFRLETDRVSTGIIAGHFGGDGPRVAVALAEFGFLEAQEDGWRVRGADRYLRLKEARRQGGLKSSANLKRGKPKSPATPPAPAELQPSYTSGSAPALSPNTEHRTPKEEEKKAIVAASAHTSATQARPKPNSAVTEPAFKSPPPDVAWWLTAQAARSAAFPSAIPEINPPGLSAWFLVAMAAAKGDESRLLRGYGAFLKSPHWRARQAPCPAGAWFRQWSEFLPDQGAPPEPGCVEVKPGEDPYADEMGPAA